MNKEIIDQTAHFTVAFAFMCAFMWPLPWWEAALLVMLGAFMRELNQHDWDWRRVGTLDLSFFAIGAASAAFLL
ncbi:hypothetical protein [Nitrosospira sp. Nl5]|uniref:hypothetical protein n=1 Tax=Nitrosospira sp. Nl5 TaxID=200120 RepID=UPI000B884519|nr:hypothetical protein [Nitrosospira sp. Nl5]